MHNGEELSTLSPNDRYWIRNFKMDIATECKRFGEFPPLMGCNTVPRCLVSIMEFDKVHWPGSFVQSFKDDYKFDGKNSLWNDTERFIEMLLRWRMGMLTPDYSTFSDTHSEICRWNRFRSRIVGYHLEKRRVPVIPTLIWWDDVSADEAHIGLRKGQVYAVSTINVVKDKKTRCLFGKRIRRICSALKPKTLLVYGSTDNIDWGDVPISAFPNDTYDWTRRTSKSFQSPLRTLDTLTRS